MFIRGRWVYSCAPWGSSGSLWLIGYIRILPGGGRVQWRSGAPWRSSDSIGIVEFIHVHPGIVGLIWPRCVDTNSP